MCRILFSQILPPQPVKRQALRVLLCAAGLSLLGHAGLLFLKSEAKPHPCDRRG